MDKNAIWKWLILIALTAWSLVLVTPVRDKVKLGLDLQGGTRFVLEVDTSELTDDSARDAQSRALEVIRNRVDAMGVSEPIIYTEPGNRIIVEIPGLKTEDRERAVKNIQSAAFLEFRMVHPKNEELVNELFNKGLVPDGYRIISLDEQGRGGQWIQGKYLKRDKSKDPPGVTEKQIRDRLRTFQAPRGYEFMLSAETRQNQTLFRPHFVSTRRELTGERLANAGVDYRQFGQPVVTLKFDSKGAKLFANLTSDYAPGGAKNPDRNSSRQLAIVLDGTLYSAPNIREPIYGGSAQIEGNFTLKEAQDLSIVLRAGALPAPVNLLEERSVDPTLGRDSIESGKRATLIGASAVFAFMILYYRLAGVVANLALIFNIILLPLGLMVTSGFFSLLANQGGGALSLPTLTLPGIAGIALTVGMAVDANVLIYERMREEQQAGKRFKFVIGAGYDKAFSAIFDSNITTLITAAILFWQGTGPVRGYAVMLSAGIIVSMYTALIGTRMLFELLAAKTNIQNLRMLSIIRATKVDFLSKARICVILSLIVIIGSWVALVKRGKDNFSVDFTGGSAITFQFKEHVPVEKIRDALTGAGVQSPFIQYQKVSGLEGEGQIHEYLEIKVDEAAGTQATSVLMTQFADAGFRVLKEDKVGPQIGAELRRKALVALALSLVAIIIYVSIRFEFPFAVGAVVALLHDAMVAIGIYSVLGRQFSVSMVAALLTIIGYSVNDTIVIFDRIRENLKLGPGRKFAEVANESINQTLGRTILTSFATLLSVAALLMFGGGAIYDFALVLFIGMISGVYSTIYIATPVALLWHRDKKDEAK